MDQEDEQDLAHVTRLRDVLVDASIYGEPCGVGLGPPTFRATVMVFD